MSNVYFDTCVYHQAGIDLLVRGDRPGQHPVRLRDDRRGARHRPADRAPLRRHPPLRRRAGSAGRTAAAVYEGNARRVYPRLDAQLTGGRAMRGPSPTFTADPDWLAYHPAPSRPAFRLPEGTVDAHCTFFGPGATFPYASERKYTPCDAGKDALFALRDHLGVSRNVIVQATCPRADNRALVDALLAADGRARGVATVRDDVTDTELADLHAAGVRAVRFQLRPPPRHAPPGPVLPPDHRAESRRWAGTWWSTSRPPTSPRAGTPDLAADHRRGGPHGPARRQPSRSTGPASGCSGGCWRSIPTFWSKVSCPERLSAAGPPGYPDVTRSRASWCRRSRTGCCGHRLAAPEHAQPHADDGALVDLLPQIAPTEQLRARLLVDNPNRLYWSDQP